MSQAETTFEPRQYPVVMIGFIRPDMMRQVINSIRVNKPKTIMVSIDGARPNRPDDQPNIDATVKVFEEIDWPCELEIKRQEKNLGCRHNPAWAISWMLDRHGAGVILEDDCVASPSFLPFCWELLERYEHDSRISMISGICLDFILDQGASYGFSKYCFISAWATWKDRWDGIDLELKESPKIIEQGLLDAALPSKQSAAFWKLNMQRVHEGSPKTITAWDIQWTIHNFLQHRVSITPRVNLICNIGTGPEATNSLATDDILHMQAKELEFPLKHPKYIVEDAEADRIQENKRFSLKSVPYRAARRALRELKGLMIKAKGGPGGK